MHDKANIRREILFQRDSLDRRQREQKNQLIYERLTALKEFKNASTILLYASFRTEVDTYRLINYSLEIGKRVFLPRVNPQLKILEIREIKGLDELKKGHMGIPEPLNSPVMPVDLIDLIIVPGVAFDRSGGRIGYGAGYYDKLLSLIQRNVHVIAISYDEQLVNYIPIENHDKRVDIIVTDREVIYCGSKKD